MQCAESNYSEMAAQFFSLAIAASTAAVSATAASNEPVESSGHLRIEWSGDARCHPSADVVDGLHRLLGAAPEAFLAQDLVVSANIEERSPKWILVLSVLGAQGPIERRLEAASCTEIAQAAALILSLWIQPAQSASASSDQVTPSMRKAMPLRSTVPEAPPDPDAAPSARRRVLEAPIPSHLTLHRRAWRVRSEPPVLGYGFVGVSEFYGALPDWGWGVLVGAGAKLSAWRLELRLLWLSPQQRASVGVDSQPHGQGSFQLIAPGVCLARAWRLTTNLNLQPGLWSYVGRLHGEASGSAAMAASTPSDDGWGAAGLSMDARLRIGRLLLFGVGVGGGLPFGRPRFFVGDQFLYRTKAAIAFGTFTLGATFP